MDEVKKTVGFITMKTVLVTGAAKRLGRAIALHLAGAGWNVAIHYHGSAVKPKAPPMQVRALGVKAATLKCRPVARRRDRRTWWSRAAPRLGPLTALINSASLFENDDWQSASRASWDAHMETNLRAPFVLSQAFARQVGSAKGAIVNIVDQRVLKPTPQFLSYSLSKAGLYWLTTTLAQALGPRYPGQRRGPRPHHAQCAPVRSRFRPPARCHHPEARRRAGRCAQAVRYLLDAEAVTGQMLAVDGGQHLIWQTPDVRVGE